MKVYKIDNSINRASNVQFKSAKISDEVEKILLGGTNNNNEGVRLIEEIQKATGDVPLKISISDGGVDNMMFKRLSCYTDEEPLQFKISNDGFLMKVIKYILSDKDYSEYGRIRKIEVCRPYCGEHIDLEENMYKNGRYQPYVRRSPLYVRENILDKVKKVVEDYKDTIRIWRYYKCDTRLPKFKDYSRKNPLVRMILKNAK